MPLVKIGSKIIDADTKMEFEKKAQESGFSRQQITLAWEQYLNNLEQNMYRPKREF